MLPSVVIVGRPNVGKSTLFNLLTGSRRSIVGDEPGITRDRIYGEAEYLGRRFEVVDTGGIVPDDADLIPAEIFRQARVAIDNAAHIIFLIDGRTEITSSDRDLARLLKSTGKPVSLAVNKIDSPGREALAAAFHELGFDLFPISAEHRIGIEELLDRVTADMPPTESATPAPVRIRVAIIGRPNVGKSTLLNALVGQDRAIVSPVAGTTRDAVDESVTRDGAEFVFVDTAGIRRKGKTQLMAEKLAVVMARRHIANADCALLLVDAEEGPVALDATIAGYAHEAGRPVILCVNKWDTVANRKQGPWVEKIRFQMRYLDYAPVVFLSAKKGQGVKELFPLIRRCWDSAGKRVPTSELNRFFEHLKTDRNSRFQYVTQAGVHPPTFVVFKSGSQPLHFSTERYLINEIRARFEFVGTPIVIKTRTKEKRYGRRKE